MNALWIWLEGTPVAGLVGGSTLLTGAVSAVHLLGFTLATGGALVGNLRLAGAVLADQPHADVSRAVTKGVALGLLVSIVSGVLLFASRATTASANPIFQTKMALLAAAALFHFAVHRYVSRRPAAPRTVLRTAGVAGLLLWSALALAGCAFILLE